MRAFKLLRRVAKALYLLSMYIRPASAQAPTNQAYIMRAFDGEKEL